MGLLEIYSAINASKKNIMDNFLGAMDTTGQAESPANTVSFGNADEVAGGAMPDIEMFDSGTAIDSANLMRNTMAAAGITNPSASMVEQGSFMPLPSFEGQFTAADTTGRSVLDLFNRNRDKRLELEQGSQGSGMLEDPNNFLPTPEAGMLRMS